MKLFLCFLFTACITPQRENRSRARTQLGTAYLKEGSPADAIGTLEEAVDLNPRNSAAWEKLAIAYYARGAAERSEKAFKKAIRIDSVSAEIRNNYGLMLMHENRIDDAIEQFDVALEDISYRNTAIVLNNLGRAYHLKGRNDQALVTLNSAIDRAPNLCQARFYRGVVYKDSKLPEKALVDFEEVISLCGDVAMGAYYQAGQLLISQGDLARGCSYLRTIETDQQPTRDSELLDLAQQHYSEHCSN